MSLKKFREKLRGIISPSYGILRKIERNLDFIRKNKVTISSGFTGLKGFDEYAQEVISDFSSRIIVLSAEEISSAGGNMFSAKLPSYLPIGDSENKALSSISLFENGIEIGPKEGDHNKISELGMGRFSHWKDSIFFSASDNSSPLKNGRQYSVLFPSWMINPQVGFLGANGLKIEKRSDKERFDLARNLFKQVYPEQRLPDYGKFIDNDNNYRLEADRVSSESDLAYDRRFNLKELCKLTINVAGDFAECGIYQGASSFFMADHIYKNKLSKKLYLFDSFEGLSKPSNIDGVKWKSGDMKSPIELVINSLSTVPNYESFVEMHKGWIPEKFHLVKDRVFSFVHIDVDLFDPTKASIEFFYPRVQKGGIILFDDYGFASCPGATKSIDEFMSNKPEAIVNLASGGAFIIKS